MRSLFTTIIAIFCLAADTASVFAAEEQNGQQSLDKQKNSEASLKSVKQDEEHSPLMGPAMVPIPVKDSAIGKYEVPNGE